MSRDAAAALSKDPTCTASLSRPLPPHAVARAEEAGQQHVRQLPFRHKLQLLCTAAASGSEVNLEVAWELLQPSVFPEMLQRRNQFASTCVFSDPGVAAVEAGHPHLLPWLVRHCPGLMWYWQLQRSTATWRDCRQRGRHYRSLAGSLPAAAVLQVIPVPWTSGCSTLQLCRPLHGQSVLW